MRIVRRDCAVRWNPLEPGFQCADQQALAEPARPGQELELVNKRRNPSRLDRCHFQKLPEEAGLVDVQAALIADANEFRTAGVQRRELPGIHLDV